jgi:hypothetical protein
MTHIFKCSPRLSAGCLACLWAVIIAGCGKPSIVGLHPEAPTGDEKGGMSLQTDFVEVDTLTSDLSLASARYQARFAGRSRFCTN